MSIGPIPTGSVKRHKKSETPRSRDPAMQERGKKPPGPKTDPKPRRRAGKGGDLRKRGVLHTAGGGGVRFKKKKPKRSGITNGVLYESREQ